MSWFWDQSSGVLSHNGKFITKGYSGKGRGINNPALQNIKGVGPIPAGNYTMTAIRTSPNTGRATITLMPASDNEMFGRSEFRIHGDNHKGNLTASSGCIVLPYITRVKIWDSKDHHIKVKE